MFWPEQIESSDEFWILDLRFWIERREREKKDLGWSGWILFPTIENPKSKIEMIPPNVLARADRVIR
jgi:hypothetical protein